VIKFVSNLQLVWWFSLGNPVSSTNKTDRHDITDILLKVALNTIKPKPNQTIFFKGIQKQVIRTYIKFASLKYIKGPFFNEEM
jgi:hypothetical protein